MQKYRRNFVPGGTYFFTANLLDRASRLLVDEVARLGAAIDLARERMPFSIEAWVVLPDHIHCISTLPPDDADDPARWRIIKSRCSRRLPGYEALSASRARKGELGIWKRRHWEHTTRDEVDVARIGGETPRCRIRESGRQAESGTAIANVAGGRGWSEA
jgi:putative transposase